MYLPKEASLWRSDAEDHVDFFYSNALSIKKAHVFANRYVKGLDGNDNPFDKIHELLHTKK